MGYETLALIPVISDKKEENRSEHVGVAQSPPCPKYTTLLVSKHVCLYEISTLTRVTN